MAFGRRLLDLITMTRSIPEYAPTSPRTVPILGPNGEDFSIEEENPEGPIRQIGSRRVPTPFGSRLRAALPDMISSGIASAAHQNTAGGGPADFFGALQDASQQRERKQLQGITLRRQANQDSIAERKARVDEGNLQRQIERDEAESQNRQATNTRLAGVASTQADAAIQKEINDAVRMGAQIIPPQAVPSLQPEERARVRTIGGVALKYPSEQETFQKGRVKINVPEDLQKQFGLPPEHYVKPEELDSFITAIKSKQPNLVFERHEDEASGDVTVIGRDPATGAEKFRSLEKGISKKRPPQAQTHGSYQPIYDEFGNIKSFFNPLTNDNKPAPEGARKPLSEQALTARATLLGSIADAETLGQLGEKYQKHIGFIKGRLDDVQRKTLGVDEGINDMFRIADDLADKLLRARSGAAITDSEYSRLRSLMPDPRSPYIKFKSDLRLFLADANRTYKNKTGKNAPTAASAATTGAVEEWVRDAGGRLVKK